MGWGQVPHDDDEDGASRRVILSDADVVLSGVMPPAREPAKGMLF